MGEGTRSRRHCPWRHAAAQPRKGFPGRRSGLSGTDAFQRDHELGVCPRTGPPPGNARAFGAGGRCATGAERVQQEGRNGTPSAPGFNSLGRHWRSQCRGRKPQDPSARFVEPLLADSDSSLQCTAARRPLGKAAPADSGKRLNLLASSLSSRKLRFSTACAAPSLSDKRIKRLGEPSGLAPAFLFDEIE
jgi:hypothetical protein